MKVGKSLYLLILSVVLLLALTSCITKQPVPLTVSVTKAVTGINGVVPVKTPVSIQWSVGGVDKFTAKIVVSKDGNAIFEKSGANLTEATVPEYKLLDLGDYSYYVEVTAGEQTVKTKDLTFKVVPSVKGVKVLSQDNTSILKDTSKVINWEVLSFVDDRNYEFKVMLKKPGDTDFSLAGTTTSKSFVFDNLSKIGNYNFKVVAVELGYIEVESPVFSFQVANESYTGENHFPEIGNPMPENNMSNVSWDYSTFDNGAVVKLSWLATDVDNDNLEFDVYVENTFVASTTSTNLSISGFSPENVVNWHVVARDSKGFETTSPDWTFTLKSNTSPVFEGDVSSTIVNDTVVKFMWNANDGDNDELKYTIYSGTPSASTMLETRYANFFNTENKNGNFIVVAKDPFGGLAEKEFTYSAPTSNIIESATVVVYVTDAKSGPAVADAKVTINGVTATTDDNGMAIFTLSSVNNETTLTIEATKTGHALTKVEGLNIKAGENKKVYLTLRKATLNPDPDTQEYPEVEFHVYDYYSYIGGVLDEISLNSSVVTRPIVVTVAAAPKSNDHINIIYTSLGKTPGSGFMTGDRGYTSGATKVSFAFNTLDYNGLTDLHVTVYDSNDNQIEIVKYLNILNNKDTLMDYNPIKLSLYNVKDLISYTRRQEIGFYSHNDKIENNNLIPSITKKFDDINLESAPENSNLWIDVRWMPIDYYDKAHLYSWPNGYNIYRSFDGSNWEKAGYVSQDYISYLHEAKKLTAYLAVFRDYSPELEPGKSVYYKITSVYDNGETSGIVLGPISPLGMFDVELTYPSMLATNVAREPIFEFKPTNYDDSLKDAYFEYALWIYDLIQNEQHLVPIYFDEDGKVNQQLYDAYGPYPLSVNYANQQWMLINSNGNFLYNEPLQPNRTYSWAVDLAYAYKFTDTTLSLSISIDQGYGADPFGGVDADAFNTFTTSTELYDYYSIPEAQEKYYDTYLFGTNIKGHVVSAYSNYIYLEDSDTGKAIKLKFNSSSEISNVNIGDVLIVKGDMYEDTYGKSFAVKNVNILSQESDNELSPMNLTPDLLAEDIYGLNPYAGALVSTTGTVTNIDKYGLDLVYDTDSGTASIYVYKGGSNNITSDATIGDYLNVKGILKYYYKWEISLRSNDDWSKQ
ncbi:Ig-like domain-containing protein [Marinitoga lauensis]|uniref:Ig-like domain-containing protein n=1 Tax=Marinitoga lauensis TaxID=2201189 RepID=UPI001010A45D|nr:Ig-like domain-containing protein [Marinitoga lauensis]